MATFKPDTTWVGLLGGGVSGSILGGGSVYQIDVFHMGGERLPVRALVTGKRLGLMAEVGTALAALVVTGCRKGSEMEGITSSGLDWELAVGLKGSTLAKTGAKLFKTMAAQAAAGGTNWAVHESAKRFVQWTMDDLGVVQSGKQFNLIPSPVSFGLGAGIFYEWQTLNLLEGKIGWQYMSPRWSIENAGGDVYFQLCNIPEQDGTAISIGFGIDEIGIDPLISWEKIKGEGRVGSRHKYHIEGYVYEGFLFERRDGMGFSGINLSNYRPVGQMQEGIMSIDHNKDVAKSTKITVYPKVFRFGNVAYWNADDRAEVEVDSTGRFAKVAGNSDLRD
ncbi:hypothetical protein RDV64_19710 [Acuticoccus sp. MNP-M23]|uniref:hypothetical protein n=1 Tax=Acuticoccus sp. MNP-M23 TaxID=3072793 RepID=UPI00281606B2|nr:hypothetical protein [Acuticoccus sp. MNP-M23]WMS42265.1 hypothetical protein RDV64_19710 [Acuticoccus sp. MNP-M23]